VNVGIVCYASVGGSGVVATELGKALAARGHHVHVISSDTPFRLGEFQEGLWFHQVMTPSYPLFREPQYLLSLANRLVQVLTAAVTVRNTGDRAGTEVVQLYLHDPVAQTTRPVVRLVGYARVPLEPGAQARVVFTVPADATSFTGVDGHRVVEPGDVELRFGRSSGEFVAALPLRLTGPERVVGHQRRLAVPARIESQEVRS
jgi:hypothetical protein